MPVRKRSRKPRAGRSRKRPMRTKKMSFKQKALRAFPSSVNTTKQVFYETTTSGQPQTTASPNIIKTACINLNRDASNYDTRANSKIFLKGFRIRVHFKNNLLRPQVVHWAMVRPRYGITSATDTFLVDWYKNLGLGASSPVRLGVDFNDAQLNGVLHATLPINTERWDVLNHLRFKLGTISTTGGYSSGELKNYRSLYRYVKINKVIDFPDGTSQFPSIDQQIYMVMWAAPWDYTAAEGDIEGAITYLANVVSVFKQTT